MKYLDGFDYATYLKRHLLVGEVDPWRRTDKNQPFYGLLVPLETAIEECQRWSGQEFTKKKFVNYLKLNDILILESATEFKEQIKRFKEQKKQEKKPKRQLTEERRKALQEHAEKIRKSGLILD